MPKFKSKPKVIDAEQFRDMTNPPRGVIQEAGLNRFFVNTIQGRRVPVSLYEWIVDEGDGIHFYPIANGKFQELYE